MCGINGVFCYGADAGPVEREELLRTREAMFSRGPDQGGLWVSSDGRVGLANRRLAILDLSEAGSQPMVSDDGRLHCVFNGEIYNYPTLRRDLEAAGVHLKSHCDTEVLLHLYKRYGPAMVDHLRGMFAFAIHDADRGGVFLARDPFGIKPLYYADDGRTIRFGSQVKALLAGGAIGRELEPAGQVGFFLLGYLPRPYTLYKRIRNLSAGHHLWIDAHGPHGPEEYCTPARVIREAEGQSAPRGLEERGEFLRDALAESVNLHLLSDVKLGVFLSAGLDSTVITGLAAEHAEGRLATFTLGFEEFQGTEFDETPLAAQVAYLYGAEHLSRFVGQRLFQQDLDHLLDSMDQPSIDGPNTYFVAKLAKEAGITVALSGLGGDELFGTYPSFTQIPKVASILGPFFGSGNPFSHAVAKTFRVVSTPLLRRFSSPKYAGMLEYGGTWSGGYLLRRALYMPWELPNLLDPEIVKQGWEELSPLLRLEETMAGIDHPRARISALEMSWYMVGQLLRDADWAGMAHSLEIRTPFVDISLLKRIAPLLHAPHPPGKRMAARRLNPPLPSEILYKKKAGFVVPIREWLLQGKHASTQQPQGERGLRGWARLVYRHFTEAS